MSEATATSQSAVAGLIGEEVSADASRERANKLGLWIFLASEAFLFSAVISSRFYMVGTRRPEELNQALGLAITSILLVSSLFANRAECSIANGDRKRFMRNTAATIGLGAVFLVGVALEFKEGLEFFPPSTAYGSAFFTLIGLHAFHVLTGILALLVVLWLGSKGRFSAENYWGVEGAVKYWHFVDVAWVFIFPTLYLLH